MYKVIKVDENLVLVGNVETKSIIRVKKENAYENIQLNDEVEVFSDGDENYVVKIQTNIVKVKEEEKVKPRLVVEVPAVVKPKKPDLIEDEEEGAVLVNMKEVEIAKYFNSAIQIIKEKKLFINALIFVGTSLVLAMILGVILKDQLITLISEASEFYIIDYIPEDFINPFVLAFVLLLSGIKVVINSTDMFFSLEMSLNANTPFLLSAVSIFGIAFFVTKSYIAKQATKFELSIHLFLSLVLGWAILGILSFFVNLNMNEAVNISVFTMDFIWRMGVVLLVLFGFFGIDFKQYESYSPWVNLVSFFFKKLRITMLLGIILTFIISIFIAADKMMLLTIGNFMFWFPLVFLGGKVQLLGSFGMDNTDLLGSNHIGVILYVVFFIITIFIWFVDVDNLKKYMKNKSNTLIAASFGVLSGVSIFIISKVADFNLNINLFDQASISAKTHINSLLIVTAVITGLTFIRLELGKKYPILNTIKMIYKKYVKI